MSESLKLNNDYDNMSDLEILANGQTGVITVLTRMVNENKKRDTKISLLEKSDKEKSDKLAMIEEKIDYIASPENAVMYRELVSICCKRVVNILDSTNDGLYFNLWKPCFNKNIHSVLAAYFKVGSDRYIKTKDFEDAKLIAEHYVPANRYLKSKIDRWKFEMENGILSMSKERLLPLKLYISDTNSGEINPFASY